MHILYLTPDITDPTTTKRVRMLLAGGASVIIAGFSRSEPPAHIEDCHVIDLGTTHDGRFLQRALSVFSAVRQFKQHRNKLVGVDLILARNMEMLPIARKAQKFHAAPIVYELLDIHRLLAGNGVVSTYVSWLETYFRRHVSLIITSSPAFIREYLEKSTRKKYPTILVENKVFGTLPDASPARPVGPPWRIGWFGAIRCAKSLHILSEVARNNPGLVEVIIRGKPAYDQLPEFDRLVAEVVGVTFEGPYTNPDDLATIYGDVHFSWAIDMFEEGLNSAWLLPNRLYEGGLYGAVPLAASNVETSRFIKTLKIGHTLSEPKAESLTAFLTSLTPETYQAMADAVTNVPQKTWLATDKDCAALIKQFSVYVERPSTVDITARLRISPATPTLVVIPCLNEHATIVQLVKYLIAEAHGRPMTIVIADGGSTDGTVDLAQQLAAKHANVRYLHNRKRIQSAAVNLAVATYGEGHGYLIRIDAHARYPHGYCATLITEANRVSADSVVVSMNTIGNKPFQRAVAAAQNSKIGNGGSAHRSVVGSGQWVDHGHHALMRIDAYRAIGGYDERFTHNEDAELDIRLTRAGRHIWLTGATSLDYSPRTDISGLFKQYRNYGRGRARTMKKHRMLPRMRQLLPIGVLPALLMAAATTTLGSVALVPALLWIILCLTYGTMIAVKASDFTLMRSGLAALIMHSSWSLGFWQGLLTPAGKPV